MKRIVQADSRRLGLEILTLAILLVAVSLPRILALDRFVTADESLWAARSANFYSALARGAFADTYQREHPGVTTMWAGSAGILTRFPAYKLTDAGGADVGVYEYMAVVANHGHSMLELLAAGRFFMVVAHTIALLLAFVYARRLLGWPSAVVGFLLIAFDPFHAALSRFLHLDGLLATFLLLALLSFLSFLHRRRLSDLLVSAIATGLGGLTKAPAAFLVPVVLLLAAFEAGTSWSAPGITRFRSLIWRTIWPLGVWGLVAMAVVVVLWPALWVDPIDTLSQMLSQTFGYAKEGHHNPVFFDGQVYPDGQIDTPAFYPISYLWRTTPIVLLGLLAASGAFFLRREPFSRARTRRAIVGMVLFVVVFTLLQNLGTKKFDRYLLPVYLPLDLVAATGWVALAAWLTTKRRSFIRRYGAPLLLAVLILLQAAGTLRTFPYYLSYYNPLLGGNRKAPEVMQIGWGEGLDQAGRYLDEMAQERDLRVAAWYDRAFSPFFSGATRAIPVLPELNETLMQQVLRSDYAVIYHHQWQRHMPRQLLDTLAQQTPVHSIWIDGLEYIRVYELTESSPPPEPAHVVTDADLGGRVRLVGYDPTPPLQTVPGATLSLTLYWETLRHFDTDYTVFVHLVGADGYPVAQADSQPLQGTHPTSLWDAGDLLVDPYDLQIPAELPSGEYELIAGMYLLSTGERLPAVGADGRIVGNSISLGRVIVVEP
jgi:hypothetical protein